MYQKIKSILDLIFSFLLIVLCAPLIFVILIGSSIAHRSNPVFTQERTGKNGVPFTLYKIKSMRDIVQGEDNSDAARLTRFGRFLRQTSLDEMLQLLNILRGDMSFIGPRPQIHAYVQYDVVSGAQALQREARAERMVPGEWTE